MYGNITVDFELILKELNDKTCNLMNFSVYVYNHVL